MSLQFNSLRVVLLLIFLGIFLPSHAFSFECAKASTDVEAEICANSELKSVDDSMERAYFDLRSYLSSRAHQDYRNSQRNWLNFRNQSCGPVSSCLIDETQSRFETLDFLAQQRPLMIPEFHWQEGSKNLFTVRINALKFVDDLAPGAEIFNAQMDKVIKQAPLNERTEDQTIGRWEHEVSSEIKQLTRNMISVSVNFYEYGGGAHPNHWNSAINVDLKAGRLMQTQDLFSQNAISKLTALCRDQIIDRKSEIYDDSIEVARKAIEEDYPGEVEKHVRDMTTWNFNENGATITFDPYEIGAYAEGDFYCEYSEEQLVSLTHNPQLIIR